MSYFDIPAGISYEDWIDIVDDGRSKGYCKKCTTKLYPDDPIIYDSHLDIMYCSDTCFFNDWEADSTDTVESLGGIETTIIDIAIDEWFQNK